MFDSPVVKATRALEARKIKCSPTEIKLLETELAKAQEAAEKVKKAKVAREKAEQEKAVQKKDAVDAANKLAGEAEGRRLQENAAAAARAVTPHPNCSALKQAWLNCEGANAAESMLTSGIPTNLPKPVLVPTRPTVAPAAAAPAAAADAPEDWEVEYDDDDDSYDVLEARLAALKSGGGGARKSKTRKSKTRKSKTLKSKTRKNKTRKSKTRKSKTLKSKTRKSKTLKSKKHKNKKHKSKKH
jgi:hypothetical protein